MFNAYLWGGPGRRTLLWRRAAQRRRKSGSRTWAKTKSVSYSYNFILNYFFERNNDKKSFNISFITPKTFCNLVKEIFFFLVNEKYMNADKKDILSEWSGRVFSLLVQFRKCVLTYDSLSTLQIYRRVPVTITSAAETSHSVILTPSLPQMMLFNAFFKLIFSIRNENPGSVTLYSELDWDNPGSGL